MLAGGKAQSGIKPHWQLELGSKEACTAVLTYCISVKVVEFQCRATLPWGDWVFPVNRLATTTHTKPHTTHVSKHHTPLVTTPPAQPAQTKWRKHQIKPVD